MKRLISLIAILTLSLSSISFADNTEENPAMLGVQYYNKQDYAQAIKWFTKAAEQGNTKAQQLVALMYKKGQGVKQDYAQTVKWFTKAAEQGDADAQYSLALMYGKGQYVKKSIDKAILWLTKADKNGSEKARKLLDKMGYKEPDFSDKNSDYSNAMDGYYSQNYKQALKWGMKALKTTNNEYGSLAQIQNMLADLYYYGHGVKEDRAKSCKWRIKAEKSPKGFNFDMNVDKGQYQAHLGICYYYGQGVKKSKKTGIKWFKKAAKNGSQYAKDFLKEKGIKY